MLKLTSGLTLAKGRIHEIMGSTRTSFAGAIGQQIDGPIIWIGRQKTIKSIHPMGLKQFVDPGRLVLVNCLSRKEILWAAEQALRAKSTALIIIELSTGPNLTESRRLQLAAEESGGIGLILIERRAQTSSAQTRWNCQPTISGWPTHSQSWQWTLTKNKSGSTGSWRVTWQEDKHAPDYVRLVSATAA